MKFKFNIKQILFVLLFSVLFSISLFAQPRKLKIVKDNIACLYGLKDDAGNWVVPANYIEIKGGYHNKYTVKQGEKWGLINDQGKFIIPLMYDEIRGADYSYLNGYIVLLNKKYGLLNKNGKPILKTVYQKIDPLENFFRVTENSLLGIADTNGIFIKPAYNYIELDNYRKIIKVITQTKTAKNQIISKTGYINFKNDTIIPIEYDAIWHTEQNGLFLQKNYRYCYIDKKGDTIFKPGARIITDNTRSGKMQIEPFDTIAVSYGKKWGLCTGQGKWISDTIYDELSIAYGRPTHESNLFWEIKVNGKMGYLNHSGKILIPPLYDNLEIFSWIYNASANYENINNENYLVIAENNNKTGILLPTGDTLLPLNYTPINFAQSLLYFSNENEIFSLRTFDYQGNIQENAILTKLEFFASLDDDEVILKDQERFIFAEYHKNSKKPYYYPENYHEGSIKLKRNIYEVTYNYKTYYFDKNGKSVIDPLAGKEIVQEIGFNFLYKDKNGWYGFADSSGKNLLDTLYTSIIYSSESGLWVKLKSSSKCRFSKTMEEYPYNYNYCACNWARFNFVGKRIENFIYDLPSTKNNIIYTNEKAGIYDFKNQRFLIKPIYSNITQQYGINLFAGINSDTSFKMLFGDGKHVSKHDWKLLTPLTLRNPSLSSKLNSKGYYGRWFLVLENKNEKLVVDLKGKIVKKKDIANEIIENSLLASKDYNYNWNSYSPIENVGPQIYFHDNMDKSFTKEEFKFLKEFIFNNYKFRYSKFPNGGYLNNDACNIYMGNETRLFGDLWGIKYADNHVFSVEVAFNADSSEYNDQVSYLNFEKKGDSFSKITIESLFNDSINIAAVLNDCILTDLATRDDLNLDCNNPASYYSQTHGRFLVSRKGLHLFNYGIVKFTSIIPWKNLIPYAKQGGVIEYFMSEKKHD